MPTMTAYLADALLNHVFRGEVYTPPDAVYLALYESSPDEDGGGGTEVSGGSYARQQTIYDSAFNSGIYTIDPMLYPNMPATTIVAVALWDDLTAGNCLQVLVLSVPRVVALGEDLGLAAGDIGVALL